ncbi:tetratricopeptide repeat protein [Deferribacter autotrophicus]|uniref:Tetratricopeptide repeat protein n=1 Tax=Deferribacter autotrophicus TaxID=500465 RepID=A0A5A8F901_9BACT|nr:tetratricopeptide repeat protein [Deferribacter autotrophicus]KAA0259237.1 tetratricopeptide repeat protein [Deferribacter autotrophicus]
MKKIISFFLIAIFVSCAPRVDKLKLSESHYKLGLAYLTSENDFRALKEFEEALKYNPKDDRVYYAISTFYLKKNIFSKAEENILKALNIAPNNSEYINTYASILAAKGKTEEAISQWMRILQDPTYPNIPMVYYNIGYAYFTLGQLKEASIFFQKSVKMNRFFTASYLMLYDIYMKTDQVEKAEAILEKSVEYNPANNSLKLKLGEHYYNQKKYNKAVEIFEEIIIKTPNSPEAKKASKYLNSLGIYK